jgi:hypothetical protein
LITAEQAILVALREVHHIRSMYLVGRPVQPNSGHPFVGRKDQFELIKQRAMIDLTDGTARFHVELVRQWVAKNKATSR